jgi:transposase
MNTRRYELIDFEWSIIQPLLPNKPRGAERDEPHRRDCLQRHRDVGARS